MGGWPRRKNTRSRLVSHVAELWAVLPKTAANCHDGLLAGAADFCCIAKWSSLPPVGGTEDHHERQGQDHASRGCRQCQSASEGPLSDRRDPAARPCAGENVCLDN